MTLEELFTQDMVQAHELIPHGVPTTFDWRTVPRVQAAMPRNVGTLYKAFNPWGQVYMPETGMWQGGYDMRGASIEVRDMRSWLLKRSTAGWAPAYTVDPQPITGVQWAENYSSARAPSTNQSTDPLSVVTSIDAGYAFHFYPKGPRALNNPNDIVGAKASCRARIIPGPSGEVPTLIANVGADWWMDGVSTSAVNGIGQGRFKVLDTEWRLLTFTTLAYSPMPVPVDPELR